MLAMKSVDLPLTGKTTLSTDHTVTKPVYLMEVKGGKWTRKAMPGRYRSAAQNLMD
jgi:branched-chain amino acid transport system substrate-binding protein